MCMFLSSRIIKVFGHSILFPLPLQFIVVIPIIYLLRKILQTERSKYNLFTLK